MQIAISSLIGRTSAGGGAAVIPGSIPGDQSSAFALITQALRKPPGDDAWKSMETSSIEAPAMENDKILAVVGTATVAIVGVVRLVALNGID